MTILTRAARKCGTTTGKTNWKKLGFKNFKNCMKMVIAKENRKNPDWSKGYDKGYKEGFDDGVFKIEQDLAIKEGRSTARGRAYLQGRLR